MRKGLTLAELAIVLVVIGILMGMVMKGADLIEAARIHHEIGKLNKLRAAYASYFAQTDGRVKSFKPVASESNLDVYRNEDIKSAGNLTTGDMKTEYNKGNWILRKCHPLQEHEGGFGRGYNITGRAVCVSMVRENVEYEVQQPVRNTFICNVEKRLDDLDVRFGDGRFFNGSSTANAAGKINFNLCRESTGSAAYLYRIF